MANIQTCLNNIKNAVYGKQVRQSIHDAIQQFSNDIANLKTVEVRTTKPTSPYTEVWIHPTSGSFQIKLANGTWKTIDTLRGFSSYQVAQQAGFTGTEQEWMTAMLSNGWVTRCAGLDTRIAVLEGAGGITRTQLAQDARYSPVEMLLANTDDAITVTRELSVNDIGTTFFVNVANKNASTRRNMQFKLGKAVSSSFPVGAELAVIQFNGVPSFLFTGVRMMLTGDSAIKGGMTNGTAITYRLDVEDPHGMVAAKKVAANSTSGDLWLFTGNVKDMGVVNLS